MKTEKVNRIGIMASSTQVFNVWADEMGCFRTGNSIERADEDGTVFHCIIPGSERLGHRFSMITEVPDDPGMENAMIRAFANPFEFRTWLDGVKRALIPGGKMVTNKEDDAERTEQECTETGGESQEASNGEAQEEGSQEEGGEEAVRVA